MDRNLSQFLARDHISRLIEEADRNRLVAQRFHERPAPMLLLRAAVVLTTARVRAVIALRPGHRAQAR